MPEIEIKIKVFLCSRCSHLWTKRKDATTPPITCPNCNSPYWDSPRKGEKKFPKPKLPLMFHGEEVLDSNLANIK